MTFFEEPIKFVELHIEGLMWGNVYFDFKKIVTEPSIKSVVSLSRDISRWMSLKIAKNLDTDEFKNLTTKLYISIVSMRLSGQMLGELNDKEVEKTISKIQEEKKKVELDNKKLSELLSQAYIPPPQKEGLGVT